MHMLVDLIEDLLIFIGAMAALLVVLVVVIARMPEDSPLKRVLHALAYRLAATAGLGALAIPLEPIPGLDVLYDIGAPLFLIYFWITFVRRALAEAGSPRPRDMAPRALPPPRAAPGRGRVTEV